MNDHVDHSGPYQIRAHSVSHGIRSKMYAVPVKFEERCAPATTVVLCGGLLLNGAAVQRCGH